MEVRSYGTNVANVEIDVIEALLLAKILLVTVC